MRQIITGVRKHALPCEDTKWQPCKYSRLVQNADVRIYFMP